jgi:hypothetical protein
MTLAFYFAETVDFTVILVFQFAKIVVFTMIEPGLLPKSALENRPSDQPNLTGRRG